MEQKGTLSWDFFCFLAPANIDEDDDADDTEDASSLSSTRSSFFFFASVTGPSLFPSSDDDEKRRRLRRFIIATIPCFHFRWSHRCFVLGLFLFPCSCRHRQDDDSHRTLIVVNISIGSNLLPIAISTVLRFVCNQLLPTGPTYGLSPANTDRKHWFCPQHFLGTSLVLMWSELDSMCG